MEITIANMSVQFLINRLATLLIMLLSMNLYASDTGKMLYRAKELCYPDSPFSVAQDINDKGEIVGFAYSKNRQNVDAFIYDGETFKELGHLGYRSTTATRINDRSAIVGLSHTIKPNGNDSRKTTKGCQHGFVYSEKRMSDIGTLGGCKSYALDVNNEGEVVGWSEKIAKNGIKTRSFLYRDGVMRELKEIPENSVTAQALNNHGHIAGNYTNKGGDSRAFLYNGVEVLDLGSLGGKSIYVRDLNDNNIVVGHALTTERELHAFLYEDGKIIDLHTVGNSKAKTSMANAINNNGVVVGLTETSGRQQGFIYRNKKMNIANDLLDVASQGWNIEDIRGINNKGQAVGFGRFRGKRCAVLLTPIR